MDTTFVQHHPWAGITKSRDWALVSSASKSFNIPALGGAYALLPDEQSRNDYLALLKSADGLSSPSVLGMIALISAYREGGGWLDSLNHYLTKSAEFSIHSAKRLGGDGWGRPGRAAQVAQWTTTKISTILAALIRWDTAVVKRVPL